MISISSFVTPPGPCEYIPGRVWQLKYDIVLEASAVDYEQRLIAGWRRFGRAFFRPSCASCTACQSLRVLVPRFAPDRSQRRNRKVNEGRVRLEIGEPQVTDAKLALYDRFHAFQTENVGWRPHAPKDAADYAESFVDNPFPIEEWCYFEDGRLVAVGYVDVLSHGLSAIYFFHEPDFRARGLGTWNVLSVIGEAARRGLPYVYLGYFVAGCRSLEYKGRYRPSEYLDLANGQWRPFVTSR